MEHPISIPDIKHKKTGDIRDLKMLRDQGDERAKMALDVLAYRIRKYIGAYMAVLGRVDCITFEGGIGEHNQDIVKAAIDGLENFGIVYDDTNIEDEMYEGVVSKPESKVKMFIIATNEEIVIAREAMRLTK